MALTSCKDFLNAGETKSQIETAIEYANANTYPIYIKYSGSNGIVKSPAGNEIHKKVTDKFSLSFDPIGDYEFAYWKLLDDVTGEELPNGEYLSIESVNNSETSCTFVKAPAANMKLCISPILAERPRLLSYAPMLSTELSFKDSAIQAVFDCPMDINSIYYTNAELTQIMEELGITDKNDPALLKTTITQNQTEETRYYGYKKEGIIYIKNISISSTETGQSLTGFFKAPRFLTENKLIIPVDDWESLPDYGEIKVELKKDFFYTLNGKPITMSGKEAWTYQINETRDNVGPVINKIEVKCGNKSLVSGSPLSGDSLSRNTIKDLAFSNTYNIPFNFNIRARDTGNGLGPKFYVYYKKVYNDDYSKDSRNVSCFSVPFESMTSYDASFNGIFKQAIGYGVFELTFCFEDSLGNKTYFPDDKWRPEGSTSWTKAYVISVDTTKPDNNTVPYSFKDGKVYFRIDEDSKYPDLAKYSIMYKGLDQNTFSQIGPNDWIKSEDSCSVPIDEEKTTELYIRLSDYANNSNDKNIPRLKEKIQIPPKKTLGKDDVVVGYGTDVLIASDHEVTQKEYSQYMTWYGNAQNVSTLAPSDTYGIGDDYPAYYVNWYEAIMYCNLRSMAEGLRPVYYLGDNENNYDIAVWAEEDQTAIATVGTGDDVKYYYDDTATGSNQYLETNIKVNEKADGYRLAKQEEWLHLANGATHNYIVKTSTFNFWQYAGTNEVNSLSTYAWISSNAQGKTHEVRRKEQNFPGGFFDMNGNVEEWVFGNKSGSQEKYCLGGNYTETQSSSHLIVKNESNNNSHTPLTRDKTIGFRVVRTYKPE